MSRQHYFSILQGNINKISDFKPEFAGKDSLFYIEDPFNPKINVAQEGKVMKILLIS